MRPDHLGIARGSSSDHLSGDGRRPATSDGPSDLLHPPRSSRSESHVLHDDRDHRLARLHLRERLRLHLEEQRRPSDGSYSSRSPIYRCQDDGIGPGRLRDHGRKFPGRSHFRGGPSHPGTGPSRSRRILPDRSGSRDDRSGLGGGEVWRRLLRELGHAFRDPLCPWQDVRRGFPEPPSILGEDSQGKRELGSGRLAGSGDRLQAH